MREGGESTIWTRFSPLSDGMKGVVGKFVVDDVVVRERSDGEMRSGRSSEVAAVNSEKGISQLSPVPKLMASSSSR